ncbi:MAG: cobalt ECF transporter T component CbiQ [Anaerovoracaceae bacterium]
MMKIDKLAYSSSWRYKSTAVKCGLALGTLLICVGFRSFIISTMVLIIMGSLIIRYSQANLGYYLKLMTAPFVFLLLGTVVIAVNISDTPMDLFSLQIGSKYLAVSTYSLTYALRLIMVSLGSVSCLYFLILTTTILDLITLLKQLHFPWIFVELMLLIYRFIFVLMDIAVAITTAQNARLGNRSLKIGINSMGNMLASLLMLAMDKSNKLFDSMEARCYEGQLRVIFEARGAKKKEIGITVIYLMGLLSLAIVCYKNGGM